MIGSPTDEENAKGVSRFIKGLFQNVDKSFPTLSLNFNEDFKTTTSTIDLVFEARDNNGIRRVEILKEDEILKSFKPDYAMNILRGGFTISLDFGENRIKVIASDWCMKYAKKSLTVIRTKSEETKPPSPVPPELVFNVFPLDGNNTVVGGKEEGIKVKITNEGKGTAKWVRVELEGDEFLTSTWGKERNLEDIKPGETKTATFSLLMPTDLERKEARIEISVKEGRGYTPTEKPVIKFNLIPAEIVKVEEEVIEDVDYDIPKGKKKRKNGYALVIGLSKYQNVSAPKYARKDAETFKKYVSKVFGIQEKNVRVLLDEKATGSVIKGKLIDWMKKEKGFKVIYFAGHGVPDPENPREGDVYLLPYDGDTESKSTLISLSEISQLGAVSGDTVLVFLDACFSGSEGRTIQLASRPLTVARISETDAITFAAAEGTQPSKEFEKAQHGYFTYYTLLGLKGHADKDGDGWITTLELYSYVKDKVADATNNIQIPVLRPKKEIRIGKVR